MGNRLLLADDSITIQKVVAIIFANEEFELTVVDNGIAALEKARETPPDVMLVDALMPGKTGYEVCREIRRDPRLSSVPILLLIGAFEPLDEDKARDCGADATISKPFESQQLIDRVKEMLELGRTRSAAPAAAAPPVESAAEELWGDLSSFDTMAPVFTPAAPAPAAPAAPAESEPAAPAAVAAPVSAPVETPHAAPKEPAAMPAPFEEDMVEASYEDDLWGAFEMEESPKEAIATPSELFGLLELEPEFEPEAEPVFEPELEAEPLFELEPEAEPAPEPELAPEPEPEPEFEAEEFFSFEEESEEIEETGPPLDLSDAVEEPVVQPSAEELFDLAEEAPLEAAAEQEPLLLAEYEPISFEAAAEPAFEQGGQAPTEPVPFAPFAAAPPEPAVEPIPPLEPQSTPLFEPAAAQRAEAQPAAPALSEADLVAALSKISREVIERIVWEVVPDLAEALIKEEIRKLKAGIRS